MAALKKKAPKPKSRKKHALPDTQNEKAPVAMPLQKVGIRQFVHPALVAQGTTDGRASGTLAEVPADFSMYVDLDAKNKGISMSRLPRLLAALSGESDSVALSMVMKAWARQIIVDIPGTTSSYIKARVKVPKWKQSPSSDLKGIEYYNTVWEVIHTPNAKKKMRYLLTMTVRYISTCPCSMHLSTHAEKHIKGVKRANPHMQPSYARIQMEVDEVGFLSLGLLHRIIQAVENTLVTIPYPMVKREDEQAIAIACGKHQMFCEDAARLLASLFQRAEIESLGISDWSIVCDHDESIHSHFATSVVWKGVPGGLK